jgi:hypothetical protein
MPVTRTQSNHRSKLKISSRVSMCSGLAPIPGIPGAFNSLSQISPPLDPRYARPTRQPGDRTMATYTWDHIHLRTPNPEATAQWYERMLGAEVVRSMQQGKPRIDLKLGGANIFIAPVEPATASTRPRSRLTRGSIISGSRSTASMRWSPNSKRRASSSPGGRRRCGRVCALPSCARRKAFRSNCSSASPSERMGAKLVIAGLDPAIHLS